MTIKGSRGPWYERVRAAVAQVREGDARADLEDALGQPDVVRVNSITGPGQLQSLMNDLAGGTRAIQFGDVKPLPEVLIYRDPFRPRRAYAFGLRDGKVCSMWEETLTPEGAEAGEVEG